MGLHTLLRLGERRSYSGHRAPGWTGFIFNGWMHWKGARVEGAAKILFQEVLKAHLDDIGTRSKATHSVMENLCVVSAGCS